jgi:hypothetical protein
MSGTLLGRRYPMPALSDRDKERVRYSLGYMEIASAASIQLGIPRPMQTIFLLESAMNMLVDANAVRRVVCILDTLDEMESLLRKGVKTLVASQLGTLQLHPLKDRGILYTDSIEREFVRWAKRLADIFGVMPYPYSERFRRTGPGSNVGVRHS